MITSQEKKQAELDDTTVREAALNTKHSYIVQAPAGSGKTGLLVQRFLALLDQVDFPEACLAITFTRKAAAEMRARIMESLVAANGFEMPRESYAQKTFLLAKKVLEKNKRLGWNLEQNPNRLKILTIDALCMGIASQLPITSEFGSVPNVLEDAQELYDSAAQNILESMESNEYWGDALKILMMHLDNNLALAQSLLADMLKTRDQWLPFIGRSASLKDVKEHLEAGFKASIVDTLKVLINVLPFRFSDIQEIVLYAVKNLECSRSTSKILACRSLAEKIPGFAITDLPVWQGIGTLLLTEEEEFRKSVNEKMGFPAPSKAIDKEDKQFFKLMKDRMQSFLETLADNVVFKENLMRVMHCPEPFYSGEQWQIIEALIQILPVLVAQLKIEFQEKGAVDFVEIGLRAEQALGNAESPSDIALGLDYKIKHILVDEFQDTSIPQFRLLEQLTTNWQPDDGRTLFLVGDPMQSIYRFRQAEVGLFIRAKEKGVSDLKLKSLTLTRNFRSQNEVVQWINDYFKNRFPQNEDITLGAIPYTSSVAHKNHSFIMPSKVEILPVELETESEIITNIIKDVKSQTFDATIAIIVRSRSHLQTILPRLRADNIPFQGIQLETLSERPIIIDLLSLTNALLHLGDRVAWLSILRMPCIQISINDLYFIAQQATENTILAVLQNEKLLSEINDSNRRRLMECGKILQQAVLLVGRQPLREIVFETWMALGGHLCLYDENSLEEIDTFLNLLEETNNDYLNPGTLEKKCLSLYARSTNQAPNAVQIMTIHKAKGLEFDVVIVPGLGRKVPPPTRKLLLWGTRSRSINENYLMLAPIQPMGGSNDPHYDYLYSQEQERSAHEAQRLLYVAATRARNQLFWLIHKTNHI